jgi:LmbE family N-acetylglucosaminyl deacetylase
MKILLLSPHIDDAALSLGGTLPRLSANNQVRVCNFFGVSSSMRLQARFPVPVVVVFRWTEELVASNLLGYRFRNLLFRDTSITRRKGDPSESLLDSLVNSLRWVLKREGPDLLLSPLAVGGHPDHVALFESVSRCVSDKTIEISKCLFYEDMWYSGRTNPSDRAEVASRELSTVLRPVLIDVTRTIPRKRSTCRLYVSQYPMAAKKIRNIFDYARDLRPDSTSGAGESFERIWIPSTANAASDQSL